jgi:hypothetical protein
MDLNNSNSQFLIILTGYSFMCIFIDSQVCRVSGCAGWCRMSLDTFFYCSGGWGGGAELGLMFDYTHASS